MIIGPHAYGTIVKVKLASRFGFIQKDSGADVFFHASKLGHDLDFDERLLERRVKFVIGRSDDGRPRAEDIQPE